MRYTALYLQFLYTESPHFCGEPCPSVPVSHTFSLLFRFMSARVPWLATFRNRGGTWPHRTFRNCDGVVGLTASWFSARGETTSVSRECKAKAVGCFTARAEIARRSPSYMEALEEGRLPCRVLEFGVSDFGVPADAPAYKEVIGELAAMLSEGRNIVLHCYGGVGRTGTAAVAVLCSLGIELEEASSLGSGGISFFVFLALRPSIPTANGLLLTPGSGWHRPAVGQRLLCKGRSCKTISPTRRLARLHQAGPRLTKTMINEVSKPDALTHRLPKKGIACLIEHVVVAVCAAATNQQ